MLTRRTILKGLAATTTTAGSARAAQPDRPNLLFLQADDHAGYVMGCDGNRQAETPHLDKLGSEGVRFAGHYCNSPVCTPSRQSLLTGQLPYATGVTLLATPLAETKQTLSAHLRSAGYRTAVFGKMHFNRPARPGLFGFETCMAEDVIQRQWAGQEPSREVPPGTPTKPAWRPFEDPARIWLNSAKLPFPRYDEEMKGTYIARQATQYLTDRKRDGNPFALWVSFMEPHSPYDFPLEDTARYSAANFPPPTPGPEDAAFLPEVFAGLTEAEKRGIIASYYTSTRFLDRNIGRVLAKLAELDLDRDTLVIYTADHGYFLGQHGRFEKHFGYDPALRVPLIIRWPRRIRPSVVRSMTEHIDLAPTILDLLQLDQLPSSHGESLRPYLEHQQTAKPRDHIFGVYLETEQAYLRTNRYKFIYSTGKRLDWYKPATPKNQRWRRLYDLAKDPAEHQDIAPRHPDLIDRFEALMLDRLRRTHPDSASEPAGATKEDALDFYLRPRDQPA